MEVSQVEESYDTIIIGCGMAGLAAGIRLALFEQSVLIIEKHNAPGGLNSFYFKDGRKFDVGLHAVTNFPGPGSRRGPLGKLFRQLRIPAGAFDLAPQNGSRIAFPGKDLPFSNSFSELESSVADAFPGEIDGFRRLRSFVLDFDGLDLEGKPLSARKLVEQYISDPMLEDMLFCPLMYYGSAREHDMDLDQFVTLWKAIFEEGFGRPLEGVRVIIKTLLDKYRSLGGKRRMRCPVKRILTGNGRATGVELESGQIVTAGNILSTAGWAETQVLCGHPVSAPRIVENIGRLSFAEAISVFPESPGDLGCGETIIFFNDSERFHYEQASEAIDLRSGVVCFPNNYKYADGKALPEGLLRTTMIASHELWTQYPEDEYGRQKTEWFSRMVKSGLRFVPGMDSTDIVNRTIYKDMFTPRTVEKFTSHFGGAVYGSPHKSKNGRTEIQNLYLAGTDQGFLGIVGAMLSGISMANRHILMGDK